MICCIFQKNIPALTENEKEYLLRRMFSCELHTNDLSLTEIIELREKKHRGEAFTDSELRDLIVQYGLAWTGESS